MSMETVENLLKTAARQYSQADINLSLVRAVNALLDETGKLESEARRIRREVRRRY